MRTPSPEDTGANNGSRRIFLKSEILPDGIEKIFYQTLENVYYEYHRETIPYYEDSNNLLYDLGFDSLEVIDFTLQLEEQAKLSIDIDIMTLKPDELTVGYLKKVFIEKVGDKPIVSDEAVKGWQPII